MAQRRPISEHEERDPIEQESVQDDAPAIREVTLEEGRALLDREARRLLGISGDMFLRNYDAGMYDEVDERDQFGRNVVNLWFLIPFARHRTPAP